MTRSLKVSLLIASMLVVLWTTSSQACHPCRACQPNPCYYQSGYTYASPTGYYGAGGGYVTEGGGYYGGGYAGGTAGLSRWVRVRPTPGESGGPGYNPGSIGGPASGLGCGPAWASAGRLRGPSTGSPIILRGPPA